MEIKRNRKIKKNGELYDQFELYDQLIGGTGFALLEMKFIPSLITLLAKWALVKKEGL